MPNLTSRTCVIRPLSLHFSLSNLQIFPALQACTVGCKVMVRSHRPKLMHYVQTFTILKRSRQNPIFNSNRLLQTHYRCWLLHDLMDRYLQNLSRSLSQTLLSLQAAPNSRASTNRTWSSKQKNTAGQVGSLRFSKAVVRFLC